MASNVAEEIVAGRRTRSGRKASSQPIIPSPARPTRLTSRKQVEQINEVTITEDTPPADNISVEPNCVPIKKSLADVEHDAPSDQNKEEDIVKDEDGCIIYEELANPQQAEDMELFEVPEEEQRNIDTVPTSAVAIDEKSSSFPFGNIVQSETSEDAQNEEIGENVDQETDGLVDSSLLASLAGDNANSLPSVGGGEEVDSKKDDFEEKIIVRQDIVTIEKMESDDSFSEPALAEEIVGDALDVSNATIVNTEMVSEDELPVLTKPEINDAEEVSDDELPAPQRAELPADAEVISEDELPTTNVDKKSPNSSPKTQTTGRKKRKAEETQNDYEILSDKSPKTSADVNDSINEQYNPMSPTGESNDSPPIEKKAKIVEEGEESTEGHIDKKKEAKDKEKKKLPDLDKYWRSVKEDPADFTGWTYLLQYVDNESDAEAAREAYDAFLSHYPYCYGYWRKYADYEKRKGVKANCNTVFERGLEAIPLSVDLWIHYLSHVKSNNEDEKYIRSQFERAIDSCGLEFRSDKLWDAYIKWEIDNKRYDRVVHIYDRLLAIPTQGYSGHFDNFQDFINQHSIISTIGHDELVKIRSELRVTSGSLRSSKSKERRTESKEREQKDLKTGEKEKDGKDEASVKGTVKDFDNANEFVEPDSEETSTNKEEKVKEQTISDLNTLTEGEISAIKDRVISIRRKIHKNTVAAVTARWSFEEGIKRPYFHVKPLERCQLKNWKEYLEFEIEKGDRKRILVLFERCLIACALYDEFWLKMIRYLEASSDDQRESLTTLTSDVYRRACEIHHPDKPSLHLMWSAFEECRNNFSKAAEVLVNLEKKCPNLLQVAYRRINLERRRGDINKCKELYEHYIATAKNKTIAGSLAIKYARFLNKICDDIDAGLRILRQILEKDPANTRVALQMIDLALQRSKVDEDEVVLIMEKFMARENIDPEQKVLFAQRKVEFLEDFGSSAKGLQDAQRGLQIALSKANEAKKKRESSPSRKSSAAAIKETMSNVLAQSTAYNNGVPSTNTNYNYNSATSPYSAYGQNNNAYQQSYDGYYNQWQYGSGYGGYSQWSGYGNYY